MSSSRVPKPVKHSVAALIRRNDQLLTLRRPNDDNELPGIWGLPAGSFRAGETPEDLVRRIGNKKLGVGLEIGLVLASGSQHRRSYLLEMDLIEARMIGSPTRGDWKWVRAEALRPGCESGSLCCRLALELFN